MIEIKITIILPEGEGGEGFAYMKIWDKLNKHIEK